MVLNKIKSALAADDKIHALEEQFEKLAQQAEKSEKAVAKQQEQMIALTDSVKELLREQKKLSKQLESQNNTIESSVKQFNKAVSELSLFKPKLEKEVVTTFQKELQTKVDAIVKDLQLDSSSRNDALKSLQTQINQSAKIADSISELHAVIKNIKAKDFELTEHEKTLRKNDQEKMRLTKRVDQLESMLAKMKRRN